MPERAPRQVESLLRGAARERTRADAEHERLRHELAALQVIFHLRAAQALQ